MDATSDLNDLSLKDLEELAYALQIDYEPPLRESDRKKVIEEITWVSDHQDEILSREEDIKADRKRRRRRDGIMCDQEESVITGDNLLLLSDQQLIFLPFTHNGKKRYYCFTRSEAVEYLLVKKINPYTSEKLSVDDLNYIENELEGKPYPNIPVTSFLVEIEERLGGKKLEYKKVAYRELIDRLVKIVEEKAGDFVKPGSLYDFASNLSTKNYNLFLRHDELRQVIDDNTTRDDAATETLNHILNRYNLLKTTNDEKASNFILNIALAMEEFLYMIKNKLTYSQLLEEKGEQIGDYKELHWKPDFLKEEYYDNGNLSERYYVNEEGQKDGLYESFEEDGNLVERINYVNGKKEGLRETYDNGKLISRINYVNGKRNGLHEEYRHNGDLMSKVNYVNGKKEGLEEHYHKNGELSREIEYHNGLKNGKYNTYYDDGQPEVVSTYVNDKIVGTYEVFDGDGQTSTLNEYDDEGRLLESIEYENGKPERISKYKDEVIYMECSLDKEGKYHGSYTEYYEDEGLKLEMSYKHGVKHGHYYKYYPNGKTSVRGTYNNGVKVGKEERFNENGSLIETIDHGGDEEISDVDDEEEDDVGDDEDIEEDEY